MTSEMKIPQVAESITEVVVSKWLKNDGDFVNQDDILCELDSDKATFELPAEFTGILKIIAAEGSTVAVGAVICTIEGNEVQTNTTVINNVSTQITEKMEQKETQTESKAQTAEVRDIVVIPFAESITEVTIGTWLKNDGDFVNQDEALCEIETDKATQEFPAEVAGTLRIVAQTGDVLKIGDLICRIEVGVGSATTTTANATKTEPVAQKTETITEQKSNKDSYANGHPSPAADKILAEKNIDPKEIDGTGIDGRITKEDALKAQKQESKTQPVVENKTASVVSTQSTGSRTQRRERLTPLRKTVARRLVAVKNETAMLTTFNEVNMKPIMDLRGKHKDKFKEKYGIGLGFMSFFVKACCIALKEFPQVNAMIDGDEMVFNDFCDISIAVSAPKGLVVPVVRNAEALSFAEIEGKIMELANKARENKLSIPEMEGGTFTITNGGVFGSMMSTPIINAPQSAILGMHNIVERPVVINGEIVVRPIMYVALSYDHRIIDGRESVSFLVRVKQLLEEPERLLLGV